MTSSPVTGAQVESSVLRAANLVQLFKLVPDPRAKRGVRHQIKVVLTLAAGAVAAGARSYCAIAEWAADVGPLVLAEVGLPERVIPSEPTLRRVLSSLDPEVFSTLFGAWTQIRWRDVDGQPVIALDGKSVRGAKDQTTGQMPHLVAALTHTSGLVIGQTQVDAKSNEIPAVRDLLARFDLTGLVITLDALHTQKTTAEFITNAGADYVLTVKANNPTLKKNLEALPWASIPAHRYTERGHGRTVTRSVKACVKPAWISYPGCAQVLQVRRTTTSQGKKTVEVVYLICSRPMDQAQPAQVANWVQGHWCIEVRLHLIRDWTWDEDRSQIRTGTGPVVMAILRNIAITILRLAGYDNIAKATRHHQRDHHRVAKLLLTS